MCRESTSQFGCCAPASAGSPCHCCGHSPCRCGAGYRRRFRTAEEEAREIEEYIEELEKEVEGAKRKVKELRGE